MGSHLGTAQGSRAQSRLLPPLWPPWEHLLVNADHLRLLSFGAVETHQGPVDLKALGSFTTETGDFAELRSDILGSEQNKHKLFMDFS